MIRALRSACFCVLGRVAPVRGVADGPAGPGWLSAAAWRRSDGFEQAEERSEPRVVGEDAPPYAPAGGDDLGWDVDEGGQEGVEFHGEQAPPLLVVLFGPARVHR